jgi:hypothetical protein
MTIRKILFLFFICTNIFSKECDESDLEQLTYINGYSESGKVSIENNEELKKVAKPEDENTCVKLYFNHDHGRILNLIETMDLLETELETKYSVDPIISQRAIYNNLNEFIRGQVLGTITGGTLSGVARDILIGAVKEALKEAAVDNTVEETEFTLNEMKRNLDKDIELRSISFVSHDNGSIFANQLADYLYTSRPSNTFFDKRRDLLSHISVGSLSSLNVVEEKYEDLGSNLTNNRDGVVNGALNLGFPVQRDNIRMEVLEEIVLGNSIEYTYVIDKDESAIIRGGADFLLVYLSDRLRGTKDGENTLKPMSTIFKEEYQRIDNSLKNRVCLNQIDSDAHSNLKLSVFSDSGRYFLDFNFISADTGEPIIFRNDDYRLFYKPIFPPENYDQVIGGSLAIPINDINGDPITGKSLFGLHEITENDFQVLKDIALAGTNYELEYSHIQDFYRFGRYPAQENSNKFELGCNSLKT